MNLQIHHTNGDEIVKIAALYGIRVFYLAPYWPQGNPIENLFSAGNYPHASFHSTFCNVSFTILYSIYMLTMRLWCSQDGRQDTQKHLPIRRVFAQKADYLWAQVFQVPLEKKMFAHQQKKLHERDKQKK